MAEWDALRAGVEAWASARPASFAPLCRTTAATPTAVAATADRHWPEALYALDCHASGMQYWHLCKVLLALHNPGFPTISGGIRGVEEASRKVAGEVREGVRAVCGIARAAGGWGGAWEGVLAVTAIRACKAWFEDEAERREMCALVAAVEKAVGCRFGDEWKTGWGEQ